jgi:hypothetical protein
LASTDAWPPSNPTRISAASWPPTAACPWPAPWPGTCWSTASDPTAEGDTVVGQFTCSATHLGAWLGHAATGRRFERVDEVAIFQLRDGRIVHVWSLEDNLGRLQQRGLF